MPLDSIAVFSVLDRVTNSDGTPVSEGTGEFYLAGTSTPTSPTGGARYIANGTPTGAPSFSSSRR